MIRRTISVSRNGGETEEFEVLAWGNTAEIICDQEMGTLVLLTGRVKSEKWGQPDAIKVAVRIAVENCQQICDVVV